MSIFLERVNSVPTEGLEATHEYEQWLSHTVDTLNNVIQIINDEINKYNERYDSGFQLPHFTTTEINNLLSDVPDGTLFYNTDRNQFEGKENGTLVKLTTGSP